MKAITITCRMKDGSKITYGCIAESPTAACMAAYRHFWGQIASMKAKPVRSRA